jgi:uncharacterized protein
MKHKAPFIKIFCDSKKNYYIYDVNTNKLVKANRIVKDIIDLIYSYSKEDIIDSFRDKYNPNVIAQAVDEIYSYINKHGLFLQNRPSRIQFGLSREEIKEKLMREVKGITLNVTNNCNLACKYCPICGDNANTKIDHIKSMEKDVALTAVDFFFRHSERVRGEEKIISFYGGEPLLNMDVIRACVEHIKIKYNEYYKNIHFVISTNGTLLDDDIVSYLVDNKIGLQISLDGPEHVHNENRLFKNGTGSFETVIRNLERIQKNFKDYYYNHIIFKAVIAPPYDLLGTDNFFFGSSRHRIFNSDQIEVAFNYVFTYRTNYLKHYKISEISKRFKEQQGIVFNDFINKLIEREIVKPSLGKKLMSNMLYKIYKRKYDIKMPENWIFNSFCVPGGLKPFIDEEGKIGICESTGSAMSIGDIYNGYYIDKIIGLIEQVMRICNEKCRNCWAIRFCNICFTWLIYNDEIDKNKMNQMCRNLKRTMINAFLWYLYILEKKPKALEILFDSKHIRMEGECL